PAYHKSTRPPSAVAQRSWRSCLACESGGYFGRQERAGRLQTRADFGDRDRPAEAIALHRVNAGGAQEELLVGGFHAFGGDLHAEAAAQADDCMHDRCGVGCSLDRSYETAVDFQLVEGKTAQTAMVIPAHALPSIEARA